MANNVKSEIKNTGFADIPCDETIHRDDNHMEWYYDDNWWLEYYFRHYVY